MLVQWDLGRVNVAEASIRDAIGGVGGAFCGMSISLLM